MYKFPFLFPTISPPQSAVQSGEAWTPLGAIGLVPLGMVVLLSCSFLGSVQALSLLYEFIIVLSSFWRALQHARLMRHSESVDG